jgi:hypothetical protein
MTPLSFEVSPEDRLDMETMHKLTRGMVGIKRSPRYDEPLQFTARHPLSKDCNRHRAGSLHKTSSEPLANASGIASLQSTGEPPCKLSMESRSESETFVPNLAPASMNEALPHPAITSRNPEVSSILPLTQIEAPPAPAITSKAAETWRSAIRHFSSSLIKSFKSLIVGMNK